MDFSNLTIAKGESILSQNTNTDILANAIPIQPQINNQPVFTNVTTWEERQKPLLDELEKANTQLKQLNDKTASQTRYIKELEADLREERLKREVAENKLSSKDWKLTTVGALSALITGIIILIIEHIILPLI